MNGRFNNFLHLHIMVLSKAVAPLLMGIFLQKAGYRRQRLLTIAYYRDICLYVFVNLGRVDVKVYDLRLLCVCRCQSCYTVAETHTDSYQYITFLRLYVGRIIAMHTQHTNIQRMTCGQSRQSKQCPTCRNICFLKKFYKFVLGISKFHALSDECQRTL